MRARRLQRTRRPAARPKGPDPRPQGTDGTAERTDPDRDPDLTRELAIPELPDVDRGAEGGDPSDPEIELTDLSDDGLEHYHSEET